MWAAFLSLGIVAFYYASLPRLPFFRVDSIWYVAGAESFASGNGYRLVTHLGEPTIGLYPPLQSLFLAPFWKLGGSFPENGIALNFAMILLVVGISLGMFMLLSQAGCPKPAAALVSFCLAVSPGVVDLAATFFSDLLFTFLAVLILLLMQRNTKFESRHYLMLGTLVGLTYLTRTAGIALLAGVGLVVCQLAIRQRKAAPLWALFALSAAFLIWKLFPHESASYRDMFKDAYAAKTGPFAGGLAGYLKTIAHQSKGYFTGQHFLDCLAPRNQLFMATIFPRPIAAACSLIFSVSFLALTLHGFSKLAFNGKRAIGFVILVYLAQVLLWPAHLGSRVLLPIFPFMALCVFASFCFLSHVKALRLGLAIFLGLTLLINIVSSRAEVAHDAERWAEMEKTASWMKTNLPKEAKIWASYELPLYHFHHFSGHRFYLNPYSTPSQAKVISESDYVLAWGRDYQKSARIETGRMEELFQSSSGGFQVMRVLHD